MRRFTGNTALGLAVLCVAQFVVVLDVTVVATALPAIGADLGFPAAQTSWVITSYTIVLAGLLILGGRAADLAGARRMFVVGLVVFAVASAACAAAWSPAVLIAARVVQGCGAAMLSPAALAALDDLIPADVRGRALGWWTAAAAGGGASGWVLGGVITELAGWRWVFALNVPICLVALVPIGRVLPRGVRAVRRPLDLAGAALVTAGIAVGVLGLWWISEEAGAVRGWPALGAAVILLVGFARHERRAAHPLVPGGLLRRRGVLGGNLTAIALTGSTTPAMITVVLYVQETLRLSPGRGALLFPAFNVAVIAGSLAGPRIAGRAGTRRALLGGFAAVTGGAALLLTLPAQGMPAGTLAGAFCAMGLGLGVASVASTSAGTALVPAGERGVAAGLLNSSAQLGSAAGLAITVPLVASAAPMLGYRLGLTAAALIAVAGGLCALRTPRRLGPADPVDEPDRQMPSSQVAAEPSGRRAW
jgi:MFS family permease